MRNNEDPLFWVEFRQWFRTRIEIGEVRTITLKRLFKLFKEQYLPTYVKRHNGVHHAYMELITYDDISRTMYNYVIAPLIAGGVLERVRMGKYRVKRPNGRAKMPQNSRGNGEKIPIREVDIEVM